MIASLSDLTPPARAAATAFLTTIDDAELRAELTTHLCDHLNRDAHPEEVHALTADLSPGDVNATGVRRPRQPLARRLRERWWDPSSPDLFTPRVFGWGLDLNFGALAVRLGLLEPDAEDQPLEAAPEAALLTALAVPVALTAGLAGSYARRRADLPDVLPVHWNIRGRADRFGGHGQAFGVPFGLAAAGSAFAVGTTVTGRAKPERAAAIGAATLVAAAGVAVWARTVTDDGRSRPVADIAVLATTLGAPLALLTALARAGRRAEIRRDLPGAGSR